MDLAISAKACRPHSLTVTGRGGGRGHDGAQDSREFGKGLCGDVMAPPGLPVFEGHERYLGPTPRLAR